MSRSPLSPTEMLSTSFCTLISRIGLDCFFSDACGTQTSQQPPCHQEERYRKCRAFRVAGGVVGAHHGDRGEQRRRRRGEETRGFWCWDVAAAVETLKSPCLIVLAATTLGVRTVRLGNGRSRSAARFCKSVLYFCDSVQRGCVSTRQYVACLTGFFVTNFTSELENPIYVILFYERSRRMENSMFFFLKPFTALPDENLLHEYLYLFL